MAKQTINLGTGELTGDGESIRTAFDKINKNFDETYADIVALTSSAFSGDYNDLTDTPVIPVDVGDLTDTDNLLFDGDYDRLTNQPVIPADVSDLSDTGNLLGPSSELVGITVPAVGGTASANETGITYSNKIAIFTEGAFTVGVWTDVQVGWTVTDNNGFTDTIASRGGFGAASFVTTVNNWPAPASGKTYVFTSPDYQPESVNPVEITVGNNDWLFNNNGSITFPDATVQTTAYPGPPTGFFNTSANGDTGAFVLPGGNIVFQVDGVAPVAVINTEGIDVNKITTGASLGNNLTIVTSSGGDIDIDANTTGTIFLASQSGGLSIGRVGGSTDVYGEVEFNNGTTSFQTGNNVTFNTSVDFNGVINFDDATIDWNPIVSSQIQANGLPVGTRFTQPVPSTSIGALGDTAGSVTFDSDYIYYCTAAYVPNTFSTTVASPGISINTFPVVKGDYGTPTTSWTVTFLEVEYAITNVADGGDSWILTVNNPNLNGGAGSEITLYNGIPSPNIWKRVAWSNDTW